jgi:ketosteroid isomerase-like protein
MSESMHVFALRRIAWVVALALPVAAALAHPPSILSEREEKATVEEVKDFRKTVNRAIERKDAAALRNIYFDGFVHTEGKAKVDKKKRIASVLGGDPVIENAPVTDLVIRVPGGWTAIATGSSPVRSTADSKTYEVRWTAVYVRIGDGWQIAASHATQLGGAK